MWTYDLVKLHAQVKDVVAKDTAFCVRLDVWDHAHADGSLDVQVEIYDHSLDQHFRGPAPDVALALLRARYELMQPADLGLVAVPTRPSVVEYGGSPMELEG